MKKNTYVTGAVLIIVVVVVLAVAHPFRQAKPAGTLSIGLLFPMTGLAQSYGENALKGAQAALAGTTGVTVHVEDEKCDASATVLGYQKLSSIDHVDVVVGPICGSPQEAVAPMAGKDGMPVLLPAAASGDLYSKSSQTMFNIQYSLEDEGAAIAKRMYTDGKKNVVIIGYQNAFSNAEVDGFVKAYQGTITSKVIFADSNADLKTEIAKLKGKTFDGVFSTDISFLFSKGISILHRYGVNQAVYSPYPVEDPAARPLAEGVIYSFPGGLSGDQGATYGLAYDATKKALALYQACGHDQACMLRVLRSDSSFGGTGASNRPIAFKQIINGQPKPLP